MIGKWCPNSDTDGVRFHDRGGELFGTGSLEGEQRLALCCPRHRRHCHKGRSRRLSGQGLPRALRSGVANRRRRGGRPVRPPPRLRSLQLTVCRSPECAGADCRTSPRFSVTFVSSPTRGGPLRRRPVRARRTGPDSRRAVRPARLPRTAPGQTRWWPEQPAARTGARTGWFPSGR